MAMLLVISISHNGCSCAIEEYTVKASKSVKLKVMVLVNVLLLQGILLVKLVSVGGCVTPQNHVHYCYTAYFNGV